MGFERSPLAAVRIIGGRRQEGQEPPLMMDGHSFSGGNSGVARS